MMYPIDSMRLALTKLRTRKLRLTIVLIISSLLFSLLLTGSFIVRGLLSSVEDFSKSGFGERYLVSASSSTNFLGDVLGDSVDQDLIDKVNALYKTTQERKKIEAKKLGITYEPKNDVQYIMEYEGPPGTGRIKTLNLDVPEVKQLAAEYIAMKPGIAKKDFEKQIEGLKTVGIYESVMRAGSPSSASLKVLKNGKEDYNSNSMEAFPGEFKGVDTFTMSWKLMSKELLEPFLLESQDLVIGPDGSIPIVAPYSAVEEILDLKELPASAGSAEKIERLKEVRKKASGYTFEVCYRNVASLDALSQTIELQQQLVRNKSNKEYTPPELITDLPDKPCGDVRVTKDKRAKETKTADSKQLQFNRMFGEEIPKNEIIKFRIVGVNSEADYSTSITVVGLLQSVLISSLGTGWFSPIETASQNDVIAAVYDLNSPLRVFNYNEYFAEFHDADTLTNVVETRNCTQNFEYTLTDIPTSVDSPAFCLMSFGSSSVALESLQTGFNRVFSSALFVVAGLASIILMGVVGRIIADSRRETAVFRAIGAKRSDISQIYITYILFVAFIISVVSSSIAYVLARLVENRYSQDVTVQALLAYNISDLTKRFSLTSIYASDVLKVWGLIFVASLVSALLPILANMRRNPINDMRDDR